MKKILTLIMVIVLAFSVCACKKINRADKKTGETYVYVCTSETEYKKYTVSLADVTLKEGEYSVLEYLHETKGLKLDSTNSEYGRFLNEFDTLKAEGNAYISVFTTYENDFNLPGEYTKEIDLDGKHFVTSGLGVSGMTIEDGVAVLFILDTF